MSKDILNLVIQNNFTLFTINESKKPYSVCYKETYIWNNLMSSVNIYKARHTRGMFDSTLVRSSKLINLSSPFYLPIIQIYRMVLSNDDTAVGLKRGWVFSLFQEPVTLEIVSWRFHTQVYSSLSFFPANLNHQISPIQFIQKRLEIVSSTAWNVISRCASLSERSTKSFESCMRLCRKHTTLPH